MRVAVRVRPGAKTESVGGRWDAPRGPALLVSVRPRAVEGKANAAVLAAVADAFGLAPSRVALVSGERGRDKVVELDGPPEALAVRWTQLLGD
ncbi:MAG: DUF167 domain-containing protein [Sporichthyaceae bacterium]